MLNLEISIANIIRNFLNPDRYIYSLAFFSSAVMRFPVMTTTGIFTVALGEDTEAAAAAGAISAFEPVATEITPNAITAAMIIGSIFLAMFTIIPFELFV